MGQSDSITWGTIKIPYRYYYACRKTLGISVHPDLSVTVRAPNGTSIEKIRAFVHRRAGWIRKAWREFEQYLPKQPERRYIGGETHRYLGRQYRLKIAQGDTDSVKCLGGFFWVTIKGEISPERTKTLLGDWYRRHAKEIFQERLWVCHQRVHREGIALPNLLVRKMASRWGSYSAKGQITLNLALIKAPKDCIDYVIIHELCHCRVKHHGPQFWKLLHKLMPGFEERRKKLKLYTD
jgi:predicted metal-dependent hydrolase